MKLTLCLIMLLALMVPVGTAYAFDAPNQGTDNATDVVLWHGDNLTIESATISGDIEVVGLIDSIEDIAADFLAFLIVAFLLVIIFKYGNTILYALGVPVSFVYGFVTASSQEVYSPLWVAGVAFGLIGLYFLYITASGAIKRGEGK